MGNIVEEEKLLPKQKENIIYEKEIKQIIMNEN